MHLRMQDEQLMWLDYPFHNYKKKNIFLENNLVF
jgi:hypothetical protein